MKYIQKGQPSPHLMQWRHENRSSPQNLCYGGGFPKTAVRADLLTEQGNLCAYTMLRITINTSHIEHIKPQSVCSSEDQERVAQGSAPQCEDIAWSNMVACTPGNGESVPYGAQAKGDWWNLSLFISPLHSTCASRFTFLKDGSVQAANPNDAQAQATIDCLQLNHELLKEKRASVFRGAGILKTSPKRLSAREAARLAGNANGMEFPEAVRQVTEVYQQDLIKRSQRIKKQRP